MKIKQLFLIDALGALSSALMLGIVLVYFQSYIGMPVYILYFLSLLAISFSIYSFSCFFLDSKHSKTLLKIIAIVNLNYCFLSLSFMYYFSSQLTALGFTYLILEKVIVLIIVFYELKLSKE